MAKTQRRYGTAPTFQNGKPRFAPAKVCIYCGSKVYDPEKPLRPLAAEHVIPEGLGGDLLFPEASCRACEGITSAFEGDAQRSVFGPMRLALNAPSKRRKDRPATLPVQVRFNSPDEDPVTVQVPVGEYPAMCAVLVGGPPAALGGDSSQRLKLDMAFAAGTEAANDAKTSALIRRLGAISVAVRVKVGTKSLLLTLAKVGHAFASGVLGVGSFHPVLTMFILEKKVAGIETWIGLSSVSQSLTGTHHINWRLHPRGDEVYVVVEMGFFAGIGLPIYDVVVGILDQS